MENDNKNMCQADCSAAEPPTPPPFSAFIEIAKLTKTQGLKGDLRAVLCCDSPEVLRSFKTFFLGKSKTPIEVALREVRKGFVVLRLEDIDNQVAADNLVGEFLYVLREDFHLPDNTWFISDLIGLTVEDTDSGEVYGKVEEILQNAPKDVYVVRTPDGGSLLFPSVPEVLTDVDINAGIIKIRPLNGLFDI